MKAIFDTLSAEFSKQTTQKYSTSFSLGIKFLDKEFHKPIYAIYGFVRFADEIVDSFHCYDKQTLLDKFCNDTNDSIKYKISLNPILNSFQHTVLKYNIERNLIDTFLQSMKMDLQQEEHDCESFKKYILGSAEVVGLMCLRVFVKGDDAMYEKLKPSAMKLGSAFQKVNFLRDAKDDFEVLGRNYFPNVNLGKFNEHQKQLIEADIDKDFRDALEGIRQLPSGSGRGVYLAYYYYKKLFDKIRRCPVEKVMSERIRIPNSNKLVFMFNSYLRHQFNLF